MPVSVAKGDVAPRYKTEANVLPPNRATIWTNDISDCSTWTFGNGSGQVNQPWTDIDLNFECSTVGSSGFYNGWAGGDADGTPAPGMNSTTTTTVSCWWTRTCTVQKCSTTRPTLKTLGPKRLSHQPR